MNIIIISGKQGSGKSSLSEALKEKWFGLHHKNMVTQLKFADVLYEMHDAVLNILHNYLPKRDIVKDGPLLQLLGTEWGRNTIDKNVWVKITVSKIKTISDNLSPQRFKYALIILDDCRFENEFLAFPTALKIRLTCPQIVRKNRCSMWRENTEHPSEIGLDQLADAGLFDLYLNTEKQSIDECVNQIIEKLNEKDHC